MEEETRTKVVIIGVGKGGAALLPIFSEDKSIEIIAVANRRQEVKGIKLAKKLGIKTYEDYRILIAENEADIVIDASGNSDVAVFLQNMDKPMEVLSGIGAKLLWKMVDERERSEEEMTKSLEEQKTLYEIGVMLASTYQSQKALSSIVKSAMKLTNTMAGSIAIFDEEQGEMTIKASLGFSKMEMGTGYRWRLRSQGVTGKILSSQGPTVIGDLDKEEGFGNSTLRKTGIKSLIAVPLLIERRIIGILYVNDFKVRRFTEREVGIISLLGTQAAAALDKLQVLDAAKHQAITDELTQLYNHRFFTQKIKAEFIRAKRYGECLSLCMVDVDYFKNYNDINGHPKGNEVLKKVAAILGEKARACDVVVRYGGEEFSVLLPTTSKDAAETFSERIRVAVLEREFENEESQPEGRLTISVGFASFPEDCQKASDLVECADEALYQAKREGRNRVRGFKGSGKKMEAKSAE